MSFLQLEGSCRTIWVILKAFSLKKVNVFLKDETFGQYYVVFEFVGHHGKKVKIPCTLKTVDAFLRNCKEKIDAPDFGLVLLSLSSFPDLLEGNT